ncbi:hypothetical protein IPA_07595 [Ignicoccus pacificus DSM 13166]|uniref:Uncharacterized protein n=1 Tax=Ignicoccus pacificus DSM 13166 TaxID=940294 RepID=A0A977PL58_9CREN|nr:hypothetical protein IPA_07595 [Ignicoccus pacificus DSM 13166]
MRVLALLLLLAITSKVIAISLTQLWTFKTNGVVEALAFSDDGRLGAASWNGCADILDQNGNLVSGYCRDYGMNDVSFCCNKFGFVKFYHWDLDGNVYIYDLSTGTWKKVYVGDPYDSAITMLKDGFLAGGDNLAYFDFQGNKRWDVSMKYITNGPAVYNGYVYVPRWDWPSEGKGALTILKLSDGSEVRTIKFNERVFDTQVCGNYLALGTAHHVYLYDISNPANPRLLWYSNYLASSCSGGDCWGAYNVAFSPDCRYLVSTDNDDWKIYLFDTQTGRLVLERKFKNDVNAVAWWRDRIAVGLAGGGLRNGKIYMFKVEGYEPYFGLSRDQWNSLTAQQKEAISKCYSIIHNSKLCYSFVKALGGRVSVSNSLSTQELSKTLMCYAIFKDAIGCLNSKLIVKPTLSLTMLPNQPLTQPFTQTIFLSYPSSSTALTTVTVTQSQPVTITLSRITYVTTIEIPTTITTLEINYGPSKFPALSNATITVTVSNPADLPAEITLGSSTITVAPHSSARTSTITYLTSTGVIRKTLTLQAYGITYTKGITVTATEPRVKAFPMPLLKSATITYPLTLVNEDNIIATLSALPNPLGISSIPLTSKTVTLTATYSLSSTVLNLKAFKYGITLTIPVTFTSTSLPVTIKLLNSKVKPLIPQTLTFLVIAKEPVTFLGRSVEGSSTLTTVVTPESEEFRETLTLTWAKVPLTFTLSLIKPYTILKKELVGAIGVPTLLIPLKADRELTVSVPGGTQTVAQGLQLVTLSIANLRPGIKEFPMKVCLSNYCFYETVRVTLTIPKVIVRVPQTVTVNVNQSKEVYITIMNPNTFPLIVTPKADGVFLRVAEVPVSLPPKGVVTVKATATMNVYGIANATITILINGIKVVTNVIRVIAALNFLPTSTKEVIPLVLLAFAIAIRKFT